MRYTKELHEWMRKHSEEEKGITALLDEIDRLNRYITALENCEVRSKTVIKRLRMQTGMDDK